MKNFTQMMKQAQELQGKMQEMQAEMERMTCEGRAGGGLVTVTLNGKGEMAGINDRRFTVETGRGGNLGRPDRGRPWGRQDQGRRRHEGEDARPNRRSSPSPRAQAVLMARAAAGPEIERLIQLLARLPGLGPRSARRAALHLVKKKEHLLDPLAALPRRDPRYDPHLRGLRQYRHAVALHAVRRRYARPHTDLCGRRSRRSMGAGAGRGDQRPLPCVGRHALAPRRCRARRPHDPKADRARP